MKVYICPECGWMRVVSRRKNVECFKCGNMQMTATKLPYEKIVHMTEKERNLYAKSWLFMHNPKDE